MSRKVKAEAGVLSWLSLSFRRNQRRDRAEPAEAPLATAEVGDGCGEIVRAEVGPQGIDEAELGIRRFPQQKVG